MPPVHRILRAEISVSPTARSLQHLRKSGALAGVVERYNPHAKRRVDLFGFIDIVCVDGRPGVLAVQSTTTTNQAARVTKIQSDELARAVNMWLMAGNRIVVHGWSKKGPRGKRKLWELSETEIPRTKGMPF